VAHPASTEKDSLQAAKRQRSVNTLNLRWRADLIVNRIDAAK
jgi:hypothetical protein